jgi:hypothetical protein
MARRYDFLFVPPLQLAKAHAGDSGDIADEQVR